MTKSLDLAARLGLSLASSGGSATDYLAGTIGLRLRLP
jgi:hypothetical protein